MSFDWRTDEFNWDDKIQVPGPPLAAEQVHAGPVHAIEPEIEPAKTIRSHRRKSMRAVVIFLLLIAASIVIYWQIDRRVGLGRQRVEAEILASHETITSAARLGDVDLFSSFISGRDPRWVASQEHLLRKGGLVDRSAFGLTYPLINNGAAFTPTLTLAPDFRSAELTYPQQYVVDIGKGLTETITLDHTLIYRHGPDRWLLAPPEADFWGEIETMNGRYTSVTYPARDKAVAVRLGRDMEAVLAELCADLTEGCYPLDIRLSTDPALFEDYNTLTDQMRGGSEVLLPTPTLFGLPIDEESYRAISRQYAARVVGAAVANYTGWACCDDLIFYTALHQALLNQLGLKPWPAEDNAFRSATSDTIALHTIESLWRVDTQPPTSSELITLYGFVDFLTHEGGATSIVDMQRLLLDDREWTFWEWLTLVTGQKYASPIDFEREWLLFVASRKGPLSNSFTSPLGAHPEEPFIFTTDAPRLDADLEVIVYKHLGALF